MPDTEKHSNVKIYDRPERKAPSPILLALGLLLLLIFGFMAYKFATRSSDNSAANSAATGSGATNTSATRRAPASQ